jgi:hypothetical protein
MFFDVMAGERARRIRGRPDQPEFIPDPTDPRVGRPLTAETERPEAENPEPPASDPRIVDPTDPRNGEARREGLADAAA